MAEDITNVWKKLQDHFSVYDYVNDESNILRKEMANDIAAHNYGSDDIHPNLLTQLINSCAGTSFPSENLYEGKIWYRKDKKQFYYYNGDEWEAFLTPTQISTGSSSGAGLPTGDSQTIGTFVFDSKEKILYIYNGEQWSIIPTEDNYSRQTFTINSQGQYTFVLDNCPWRVKKILILDTDTSSITYQQYINAEGAITAAYEENKMVLYNSLSQTVQIKVYYS